MKPRTRTLGAIGAAVVTAGLVVGLSSARSSAATGTDQGTPTTISMPMNQMPDGRPMMTTLAQCDEAHGAMSGSMMTTAAQAPRQHDSHHGGSGS